MNHVRLAIKWQQQLPYEITNTKLIPNYLYCAIYVSLENTKTEYSTDVDGQTSNNVLINEIIINNPFRRSVSVVPNCELIIPRARCCTNFINVFRRVGGVSAWDYWTLDGNQLIWIQRMEIIIRCIRNTCLYVSYIHYYVHILIYYNGNVISVWINIK